MTILILNLVVIGCGGGAVFESIKGPVEEGTNIWSEEGEKINAKDLSWEVFIVGRLMWAKSNMPHSKDGAEIKDWSIWERGIKRASGSWVLIDALEI